MHPKNFTNLVWRFVVAVVADFVVVQVVVDFVVVQVVVVHNNLKHSEAEELKAREIHMTTVSRMFLSLRAQCTESNLFLTRWKSLSFLQNPRRDISFPTIS